MTLGVLALFGTLCAGEETNEIRDEKLLAGIEALKKIVSVRDRLKGELAGFDGKKKLHEKDREELSAIMKSIERFFPYGGGGVCDQTETIVNRLRNLEWENQSVQSGTWLVPNSKASTRLMLIVGGFLIANIAIWGAAKAYYYLRDRDHKARIEHDDLASVDAFFGDRVEAMEHERTRLFRDLIKAHARQRQVRQAFDGAKNK
ncbi:hypothetical protein KKA53_00680 [Candidatus Dependentiae bacterium]|nr:hypothetical protein [Candidatus Dependentiae bacterium]